MHLITNLCTEAGPPGLDYQPQQPEHGLDGPRTTRASGAALPPPAFDALECPSWPQPQHEHLSLTKDERQVYCELFRNQPKCVPGCRDQGIALKRLYLTRRESPG